MMTHQSVWGNSLPKEAKSIHMCSIARDKHEYLVRPPHESQMGELLRDAGAFGTLRETVDL
jgi:hypothetical protein